MSKSLSYRALLALIILFTILPGLLSGNFITTAQDAPVTPIPTPGSLGPGQSAALVGWLSVIQGDPQPGTGGTPAVIVSLQDDRGGIIANLDMNASTALEFYGQRVQITGRVSTQPLLPSAGGPTIEISTIQEAALGGIALGENGLEANLVGSQPWVNVLCRFPDIATTPATPAQLQSLFSNVYPGLDHYWRQLSYDNINLTGTTTTSQWYVLPYPRSHYVTGSGGNPGDANLEALFNDCTAAADAAVNYTPYVGINLMFNADLDCCAWGGSRYATLDGQSRVYRTTWLPPWSQVHNYIAHEMGHGFGLPHSAGPADHPPSGLDVYVSAWDVMSRSWGTGAVSDPLFGYIAPGTIAYHLDLDGWIPTNRRAVVERGMVASVLLEHTALPPASTNPLIARLPITSSTFYTVEVRDPAYGYDQNVPARAVVIHYVDTNRSFGDGHALVVDDINDHNDNVNDAGSQWLPGETFRDTARNVTISVISSEATGFRVNIGNNVTPPANDDFNAATRISANTYNQVVTGEMLATRAIDDPVFPCTSAQGYYSLWYSFSPAITGILTIDTLGSGYDTVLGIWTGNRGSLQNVGCSNDFSGLQSQLEVPISSGTTYYIEVAGTALTTTGTLHFNLSHFASPTNAAPIRNLFTTHTPTLTWNRVTGASGYQIQVNSSTNFGAPYHTSAILDAATLSYTLPVSLADGTWYWRARTFGGGSTWGPWSAPDVFVIDVP